MNFHFSIIIKENLQGANYLVSIKITFWTSLLFFNNVWKFQNSHNCFMDENWKLTKFMLQIHLCTPDCFIWLSPTKYHPSFVSENDLKQNENNDRCNTVQKNAPFQFSNSCYNYIFHFHGLRFWEKARSTDLYL